MKFPPSTISRRTVSRRTVLRAGSSAVALPLLPSLGFVRGAKAAAETARPKRLIFLSQGWGNAQSGFLPDRKDVGPNYTLTPSMEPLARHKDKFSVFQGFMHNQSALSADPHWASTFWLTGANRYGKPGSSFSNTISADQVAAKQWGASTRHASLQFNSSVYGGYLDGHGAGLSLAWDEQGKPIGGVDSPVAAFHKLFSAESASLEERQAAIAAGRSVLDVLRKEIANVKRGLSKMDIDKLNEYLAGVRDIEARLANDEKWLTVPKPEAPGISEPSKSLKGIDEINLMYDLMVAAFRTDSTRVVTYRQPVLTLYQSMGLMVDTHAMSHSPADTPAVRARDKKQLELLAGLIDRLVAAKEPDGSSLFDHTTVAFGSNLRSVHYLDNVTTILFGRGAGIRMGENFDYPDKTPLNNVWLSMLKGSGVAVDSFGDATGPLTEIMS